MRIVYRNRYSDLLLFHAMHQFFSFPAQLFFVAIAAIPLYFAEPGDSVAFNLLSAFALYLFMWLIQLPFNALYLYSTKNIMLLSEHVIEVTDVGLVEETKFNKNCQYWPGVLKMVLRPGFVAIYINPHAAHIIPTRAFASLQQRSEFVAAVSSKIEAGKAAG